MENVYKYYEIAASDKSLTESAVMLWHKITASKLRA